MSAIHGCRKYASNQGHSVVYVLDFDPVRNTIEYAHQDTPICQTFKMSAPAFWNAMNQYWHPADPIPPELRASEGL